jgi:hydroxyethylthiazole kinase-like uncharacterized protein yjeF
MRPILTVEEMREVDAAAQAQVGIQTLIQRAGWALARAVRRQLGGTYGRRVVVVAGPGHNGDDGRVAAGWLERWGARVSVLAAGGGEQLPACDVVIDAAYGTGFRGSYVAPVVPKGARVVAVDVPTGLDGDTGEGCVGAVVADATVTFCALKPGLLIGDGPWRSGTLEVADIGLDPSRARAHLVEDADLAWLPARPADGHKWQSAVYVAAGSPGMLGAPSLCSRAAMRAGAGMVRLGVPGLAPSELPVSEVVASALAESGWEAEVLDALARCRALVLGPGLGTSQASAGAVRQLIAKAALPVLADADALNVVGEGLRGLIAVREAAGITDPVLVTPHDGEYARLAGHPPGPDRFAAARSLAERSGAIVLLKGTTTVVAAPDGRALAATSGSSRLATAGTGDVLAGVIGAFVAEGVEPLGAAALAAHVHGRAAAIGLARGLVAGDLLELVARYLSGHTVAEGHRG